MKKLLVIGSKGMAGHIIKRYLSGLKKYQIHDIARGVSASSTTYDVDVFNTDKVCEILVKEKYNVVINCIGSLNKDAEDNPEKAIFLNSYLPHFLAKNVNQFNGKLIHISTDCVFNGKKGNYVETDQKDGFGFYAQSKALGEVINDKNLTFRTSIIGPELKNGIGLLHWFLMQNNEVNGYTKAFWTGVTTLELAKAIDAAIDENLSGLYHLVNSEKIDKFSLVTLFKLVFSKEITIIPFEGYSVDKSLINTRNDFDYQVKSYKNMIVELQQWMVKNKDIYQQYF